MEECRKGLAWERLAACVPFAPSGKIDWIQIAQAGLGDLLERMKEIPQNPLWHGEGSVWQHTCMVCEELVRMEKFRRLERKKQVELFVAAILHDIGKLVCTRQEDGVWTSPNHTAVGAKMARALLWREYDLAGTGEKQNIRETICFLIRCHSVPMHIWEQQRPERRLIEMAAHGRQAGDFSLELLLCLVEADMRGRIAADQEKRLEELDLCRELALEWNCLHAPYPFASSYAEHAWLNGRLTYADQDLYDDTWGEVILLSGLPGTGKDTWASCHHADLPVVSLDSLRDKLGVAPTENQGAIVQAARTCAREYLRKKQPFVWNATCLSPLIRRKQVSLFESYHARVRIVFLETGFETGLERNRGRRHAVPEAVIGRMLDELVPPEQYEAQTVDWYCI